MRLNQGRRKAVVFALPAIAAVACAAIVIACASLPSGDDLSFAGECAHCHGERLQGVHNVKARCGKCHELAPLAPDAVENPGRKEALFSEPHIHTTKNLFAGTPSCFNCHRRHWKDL